jgi:hypothetical protein
MLVFPSSFHMKNAEENHSVVYLQERKMATLKRDPILGN